MNDVPQFRKKVDLEFSPKDAICHHKVHRRYMQRIFENKGSLV